MGWRRDPVRGAVQCRPDPGEGGDIETPDTSPRDFLYGSRGGNKPLCSLMATSHLIPTPWRPMEGEPVGRSCRGGAWLHDLLGVVVQLSSSWTSDLGVAPVVKSSGLGPAQVPWFGSGSALACCFLSLFYGAGAAILPFLKSCRGEDPVRN